MMVLNIRNSARLSKYAIGGLLAKVYLNMGDYANAETSAADVINNSGFSLVAPASIRSLLGQSRSHGQTGWKHCLK